MKILSAHRAFPVWRQFSSVTLPHSTLAFSTRTNYTSVRTHTLQRMCWIFRHEEWSRISRQPLLVQEKGTVNCFYIIQWQCSDVRLRGPKSVLPFTLMVEMSWISYSIVQQDNPQMVNLLILATCSHPTGPEVHDIYLISKQQIKISDSGKCYTVYFCTLIFTGLLALL